MSCFLIMRTLILAPYPLNSAPSQRFRFEQFIASSALEYEYYTFYDPKTFKVLYDNGQCTNKLLGFLKGLLNCNRWLFSISNFDQIFIHREIIPLGPPVLEWLLGSILKKKIIYDFDDAIWMADKPNETRVKRLLKQRSKTAKICKWSHTICCGNDFLADYASSFNKNTVVIPTVVDTVNLHVPRPKPPSNQLIVGWTGTHSTLPYMESLVPLLLEIWQQHPFLLKVICNREPGFNFPDLQYVPWRLDQEIEELCTFDIGIMPLPDTAWALGKCGFKILQYMALRIPAVASSVGVNKKIINHGSNGLLCECREQWKENISYLLTNPEVRGNMGRKGREFVIKYYSVEAHQDKFFQLFHNSKNP